jgi:hypothetical protein
MFGLSATAFALVSVAVVSSVASAAMQGVQSAQNADAAKQAADYNAQVANNNATIASQQRSSALQQGEVESQNAMRKQAQMIGDQRAEMSANGIDITQGSAQDILASTKFLGGIDVNTIQSNAARQAWGYEVQSMNDKSTAVMETWKANSINPSQIGAMAAGSSLLSSIGSAASSYAVSKGGGGGGKSGTVSGGVKFGSNTGGGTGGGWPTK